MASVADWLIDWRVRLIAAYLPSWIAVYICAFGVKLIALEIHNQLTAEPITLFIIANDIVLTLLSGAYPTKAFPFFTLMIIYGRYDIKGA